jgi:hypothetical protein
MSGEYRLMPVGDLYPNPWNPNVMDADMERVLRANIERFGFVDPVIARMQDDMQAEIIDGEHRWAVAISLGFTEVPVFVVEADDDTAKQLTLALNEVRGVHDPAKVSVILRDLLDRQHADDLLAVLPYSKDVFARLTGMANDFDWSQLNKPVEPPAKTAWVERLYRMPRAAAATLDEAIARVRMMSDGDDVPDWHGLEIIASEYLSET